MIEEMVPKKKVKKNKDESVVKEDLK